MDVTDLVGTAIRQGLDWGTGRVQRLRRRAGLDGPRPCDGLILDVDDTLIDTESAIRTAAQAAALEVWPESTTATRERFAQLFHADPHGFFAGYTDGRIRFHEMRKQRIAAAAADLGLLWEPRRYRRFCSAYDPAFAAAQRLFPDALPAVEAAEDWGIAVVLLTNSSSPATRMKLQVLGVSERFPHVVTTDTLGVGKPDPSVFLHACGLIGAEPAQCIAIGDHFGNDVLAARAAGLRALWLDRAGVGGEERAPSIPSLAAVPAALTSAI
ncbi:HAD family hydrolase [Tsukamurella strandjordii]|uniref:HAD family hydrolase n=1 Tax=Tsukamurella TaxID=2060 RepID=UPI001C7CA64E|nr:HAD family hydrolase [Tsukamurella sp. TY48]GIZ98653.1 haloacid dehalogenase [Tsukamurella sp. TY48]